MHHRTSYLATLIIFLSLFLLNMGLLNIGIINSAYAIEKNTNEKRQTAPGKISGKIVDIASASGYTYIEVDTGKEKVWAAGPTTPLNTGDMITFSSGMPMKNFHSKSMQRDFSIIYFVDSFITGKSTLGATSTPTSSPHRNINQKQAIKAIKGINKVEDGHTIAAVHSQKSSLNGKTIRVRGKVTKFTPNIKGMNWIHIRDSSTLDDLTITTKNTVAIDDIVIIEGKLGLDKDFGYGYVYPLIVENASVTK